ncbi:MAG TPA: amidohydrolase family protein [Candidatus Acidoferrum sp.]|nr:amidohydrolase family protein [Candidatus Acidoferrum sp.]
MNCRLFATFLAFVVASACLLNSCKRPQSSVLAITHVTVIGMTGAPPAPEQTVLVDKERIVAVGSSSSVSIPSGAKILDATGKFLIPGLSDMHIHLTGAGEPDGSRKFMIPLLLANGITTVRDMGGYLDSLVPLRKEIEDGKRLGPRIVLAGPYLDGDPPAFQPAAIVTNQDDAGAAVQWLKQSGVDFLKVQSNLSREAYFAIAEEAKKHNISFVGHVPDSVTASEAADAGQKSIEHLTNVLRACSSKETDLMRTQFRDSSKTGQLAWRRELLASYSEQKAAELIAKFRAQNTWQTPTLILLRDVAFASAELNLPSDSHSKYVPRRLLEIWRGGYEQNITDSTNEQAAVRTMLLKKSFGITGQMQKGSVKILAGTDTAAPFVFPGFSLHEELALLMQAGLTPTQALEAATRNPAEFLGRLDSQGTIAVGKNADLVLLDANPLDDIHNTRKINAVILRGELLDRFALDQLLTGAEKFAAAN